MSILIWLSDEPPGHCTLTPTTIPRTGDIYSGVSVADTFPTDVAYRMSDRFPDDILLSDNFNVAAQIIVSGRLKSRLGQALSGHAIEWFPVSIINHKDRVESNDYFLLHCLGSVDCIDVAKSQVKWNPLNKSMITSCKALVIDESKIPPSTQLFRPRHWGMRTMVRSELAEQLSTEGFTGLRFVPAAGYTGIG